MKGTTHLLHEDGSFQQYIALDADYLTILPDDVDPKLIGPVLCAGITAYKVGNQARYANGYMLIPSQAVLGTSIRAGSWLVVVGAGGGLGHLAGKFLLPK